MSSSLQTTDQRFWARVAKTPDGCWHWRGRVMFDLVTTLPRKRIAAVRYAWRLVGGVLADRQMLRRTCATEKCVNPAHHTIIVARTHGAKKRKLSIEIARAIRVEHMAGLSMSAIARQRGVDLSLVSRIIKGERYKEGGKE